MSVTVVVPTKDRGDLLVAAVSSAVDAGAADEILLVDAGSRDGSVERAAALPGVRVIDGPFTNAAATRNAGWRAAAGDYIAFLDSDDLMLPEKITCLAPLLDADAQVALAHGRTRVIDTDGRVDDVATAEHARTLDAAERLGTSYEALAHTCVMYTSATLMRRSALEDAGGYDESLDVYEDWDLYLRLARKWKLVYDDCITAQYRVWAGNVDWRQTAEWTVRVARRHLETIGQLPAERRSTARYALQRRIASSSHVLLDRPAARRAALAAIGEHPLGWVADADVRRPLLRSFLPAPLLARRRA